MKLEHWVLLIGAVEITVIGAIYLVAPHFMMASNGMTIATATEAHLVRAAYGGAFVAFGLLFGLGAFRGAFTRPALIALVTFMGGFAFGRITSLVFDGRPVALFIGVLAGEIILAVLAIISIGRVRAA